MAMASSASLDEGAGDTAMDREFFSFPYEPYDIQLDLMRQLYQTIDARHIGIFESPTGTVRSRTLS
jgi:Rad3-related DNA helicase